MNEDSVIWVTGASGFVGRNLVEELKLRGYTNVLTEKVDLLEKDSVEHFLVREEPETIFHCAAVVGGIQANINNPYKFLYENLQITTNLFSCAIDNGVKKVLNLCSSCVYPKDYTQPLKEEYLLAAPLEPTNEGYAIAKIAALKLAEYANKTQKDTSFISLMPCNLMGPHDHFESESSHFLAALISKFYIAKKNNVPSVTVWGDGKSKRELIYVKDLVDGMIWAVDNSDKMDSFLNIGTGIDYSIESYVDFIKSYIGYEGEVKWDFTKPNGMRQKVLDVSKINSLGWKAKTNVITGIFKTIDWYIERKNK